MNTPAPNQKTLRKALVKAAQELIQQCQNPQSVTDNDEYFADMYYSMRRIELCLNDLYESSQPAQK